ncbi:MAG: ABC transporter substrate-binding protein [bacterium]|nr:ABC transporter substrate-binding protein [bacterium]
MNKLHRIVLSIFSALLLLTLACRIPFLPLKQRILGVVGPETGVYSEAGVSIVDGIVFRAYEINDANEKLNGDALSVIHYDDGGDIEDCIKSVKRLIEVDEAFAVISYNPDRTAAAKCAELCARAEIPFVSLSGTYNAAANPVPAGGYDLSSGDEKISEIGIDYLFANSQVSNPALVVIGGGEIPAATRELISEKLPEGTIFALDKEIGRADIELVGISPDIKFSGADSVLVYASAEDTFRLVRELEFDRLEIPVMNIKPFTEPGVFDKELSLNRFVYFFTPFPDEFTNVKLEHFQRHFVERRGYEPNHYTCLGYEAADFITYAVLESGSTSGSDMKAEWDKIPVWEGMLGDTNLKTGRTELDVYMYRVSIIEGTPVIETEAKL